jgi:hypothetical protein
MQQQLAFGVDDRPHEERTAEYRTAEPQLRRVTGNGMLEKRNREGHKDGNDGCGFPRIPSFHHSIEFV